MSALSEGAATAWSGAAWSGAAWSGAAWSGAAWPGFAAGPGSSLRRALAVLAAASALPVGGRERRAADEDGAGQRSGNAAAAVAEPPDEEAFAALYGELARPLAAYARRTLGNADEARDVVQETFLRYLRAGLPAGTDPATARPYLYRMTTHLLRDRWRRAARQRRWWERHGPPQEQVAPRDAGLTRDVERAFRTLKPRDRALLWLAHVEGASHREIADALGVAAASVRVMLFRARNRLGKELGERGFSLATEEP